MPFTAAHVLAVVPAVHARRALRLDATCLVIGSMAPDFEYFVRGARVSAFGHSLAGIAGWGVPATLVLAALFHGLVKWPILLAAPPALTGLFARPWHTRWRAAAVLSAVASAALGDVTHLVWDSATHADGLIVLHQPALTRVYPVPVLGDMALHRILQHTSSLIGLAGVVAYLAVRIHRAPQLDVGARRGPARIAFAGCIGAGIAIAAWWAAHAGITDPGTWIVDAISGALGGTIVASSLVARPARRYQRRVESATAAARVDPQRSG